MNTLTTLQFDAPDTADRFHRMSADELDGLDFGVVEMDHQGQVLRYAGRDSDTLARFEVADRLRRGVEALNVATGGPALRVTALSGVAQQMPGETWTTALERADAAMYRAKNAGRNRVVLARAWPAANFRPETP